ncbi:MAG: thioredoxin family protein [Pseudomonadota bacterium]
MKTLLGAIVLALTALPAAASSVVTDHARTGLIAETDGVAPGGALSLAFAQELQSGWHVYWENPGDSGLPLDFKWTLPAGAAAGAILYPAPHRIAIGPLVNFGHEGAPVFLTSVTAPSDAVIGSSLEIALEATWLICADICVPETGVFQLSVPVVAAPAADPAEVGLFARARAAMPAPYEGGASFSVSGEKLTLRLEGAPAAEGAYFFPLTPNISEPAAIQKLERKGDVATLSIKGGSELSALGEELGGVVEFGDGDARQAFALSAQRSGEAMGGAASVQGSLLGLLAAAFLGGAFLNLMPCVFPILFVKAASMAKSASGEKSILRRHGLLYGAGVMASFTVLGGVLLALRAGGEQIGWGFHLQSPAVIAISAYVLFAVGLNFAGVFHVGSSLQNVGSDLVAGKDGDFPAFMTGVLAVVVAAPCVGPFLTAPVGAAAVLPPVEGFSIFMAMAAGLAAPYVALSFAPGLARALPKPGPWMVRFRQVLSLPVFSAAAYFLWVLSAQAGQNGLALGFMGLLSIAAAAILWEWRGQSPWAKFAALGALALAIAPLALARPVEAGAKDGTIAYDPADVAARRAAGEPVFIDFTAAWCVTCQVNKLTVLSSPKVKAAFAANNVAFIVADWTNRDPEIEQALASFGANGVPLYVFYPSGEEAVILPQPLSERSVISAIEGGGP